MARATVAYESRRLAARHSAYEKKVCACLVKLGRSNADAEAMVERAHDQLVRAESGGVDPKTEAAIIDATLHHGHPHHAEMSEEGRLSRFSPKMQRCVADVEKKEGDRVNAFAVCRSELGPEVVSPHGSPRQPEYARHHPATESPTRDEWEVVARSPSDALKTRLIAEYPQARVIGTNVVIGGFHDDEKASRVAQAITHQHRLVVSYGPRAQMAAEYGGEVSEAQDSLAGPFTRIERDPARFALVKERADAIGPLKSDRQLYDLLVPDLEKETQEVFYVVTVDVHGQLLQYAEVARGQVDRVAVGPREILPVVLLDKASGYAVAHNHPSGSAHPSDADKELTKRIKVAGHSVCPDVAFLDHLIVAGSEYYSFTQKKLTRVKRGAAEAPKKKPRDMKQGILDTLRARHDGTAYLPDVARSLDAEPQAFKEAVMELVRAREVVPHVHDLPASIPLGDLAYMPGAKVGKPIHVISLPA